MADDRARSTAALPDEIAIAKAHAIYTPFMLPFYDMLVHGVSNRFAWRCRLGIAINPPPRLRSFAPVQS